MKVENGVTTNYFYLGGVLFYTTDGSGNKTSQNILGQEGNIFATIRYETDGQHAYFYNKDVRASVRNVVDESGNSIVCYKYDDNGNTEKLGNQSFYNEICYTSGVYDALTERYYLNARYYDPEEMSFLTQDSYRGEPDDYTTWNLYAYCAGNPITYVDPSGHKCYVITNSEFKAESEVITKIVRKYYKKKTELDVARTNAKFREVWNGMKAKKIECVVINSHANPTELNNMVNNANIRRLKRKNVKRLILLGCNAGHLDHIYTNIAYCFRQKIKGCVIASDGTVASDGEDAKTTSTYDSEADDEWERWRFNRDGNSVRRNNCGWVKYSSSKKIISTKKYNLTMKNYVGCNKQ